MTTLAVDTPHGPARVHPHPVPDPAGAVALGHGAGGGVSAPDLVAAAGAPRNVRASRRRAGRAALPRRGPALPGAGGPARCGVIAVVEGGLRAKANCAASRWSSAAGPWARASHVAPCQATGAIGVLCLAFPLPSAAPEGRAAEPAPQLDAVTVPTLVVQGKSDQFGMPPPGPQREVVQVAGNHSLLERRRRGGRRGAGLAGARYAMNSPGLAIRDVLVLGGGGILGEAWMTAVLAGLEETSPCRPAWL